MKASATTAVLPPLYAGWIDSLLRSPVPPETRATCDDCAMCAPDGAPAVGNTFYFSPRVKCCSYHPKLPNYLVGRALADRDFPFAAGRAALEARIGQGVGVTPLGVEQSPVTGLVYQNSPAAFGKSEALRCPYYLDEGGGRCGIWRHRNSVCATWFCKHERGAVGQSFWHRLRDLLMAVESSLAIWCVLESDFDPESLDTMFAGRDGASKRESMTAEELDGRVDAVRARRLWGRWFDRQREFYESCGERVEHLTWKQIERLGGSNVALKARLTREAFERLGSQELPARLAGGNFQVLSTGHDGVRVVTYSGSDPLDLDPAVMEILPYFDGGPTRSALDRIEKDLHLRVEKDLVRKLADFEILVRPERTIIS